MPIRRRKDRNQPVTRSQRTPNKRPVPKAETLCGSFQAPINRQQSNCSKEAASLAYNNVTNLNVTNLDLGFPPNQRQPFVSALDIGNQIRYNDQKLPLRQTFPEHPNLSSCKKTTLVKRAEYPRSLRSLSYSWQHNW
jgi:hypothetical protein